MIVVGIDTSTPQTSVAIGTEHEILAKTSVAGAARQESVTPVLRDLLDRSDLALSQIGGVAVGIGPGLYTGLRVGVETAKTLAQACTSRSWASPAWMRSRTRCDTRRARSRP